MDRVSRAGLLLALAALTGCPGATTCYSYCSSESTVSSSCTAAGAAAQCSSVSTQAFSGSTTENGLSLVDCTSTSSDGGALVDAGCSAPTYECVASGCKEDFSCMTVADCTGVP